VCHCQVCPRAIEHDQHEKLHSGQWLEHTDQVIVTTESHHQIFKVIGHCQPAGHQGKYADDVGGGCRRHRHVHAFLILNRAEHRSCRGIDKASEHEAVDLPEPGQLRVEQRHWHACILPPGPVSKCYGECSGILRGHPRWSCRTMTSRWTPCRSYAHRWHRW
jgi:hypothetical protein